MKEFIFTWNIENISHSWHRKGERIVSPSFVADTLQNTVWYLSLYPRGSYYEDWLSLYLHREEDEGQSGFFFEFELSCVSVNNLTFNSQAFEHMNSLSARDRGIGDSKFVQRREIFVRKKHLYLSQDTLKLRCRLWKHDGKVDAFGQCFGCTRLDIERAISVQKINPRIEKEKTLMIYSTLNKTLLITVDVYQQKRGFKINLHPNKNSNIKFSTFKFFSEDKKRKCCEFVTSWYVRPYRKIWRSRFLDIGKLSKAQNKLKLTCEFIYPTGNETKSIVKVSPCSWKFAAFPSNCILSCISSGKLSDCPTVYKDLLDMYEKQILFDVQLKTQTTTLWAHKAVLCARSPVFSAMFSNDTKERLTNCVEIEDLEDDTLEKFLKFLYNDSFEETQWDAVMELYYSSDKYQVGQLKHLCCSYFMKMINDLNVYELLILADRHNDFELRDKVEDYIDKNLERIFRSLTWKQFADNHPGLALNSQIRIDYKDCDLQPSCFCGFSPLEDECVLYYKCLPKNLSEKENPVKARKLPSYPSAMDDLKSIYHSKIGSDIVIQTLTNTFPVHKTILCSGSLTLKKMFATGKLNNSIKMEDLEDDTISRMLMFLYTNSPGNTTWETAIKLFKAAVKYQIERLRIYCSCFFLENLDASNAINLLQLAHEHQDTRLMSLVEDFSSLHDKKINVKGCLKKFGKTYFSQRIETRSSKRLRLN